MTAYVDKNVLLEAMAKLQPSAEEYGSTDNRNKIAELEDAAYWAARDLYDDIKTMINVIDSDDVAPAVHGHWKNVKRVLNTEWGECSNCDRRNDITPYCPQCGAKMDENEDKQ